MTPKITLITVTYNAGEVLRPTLESVLQQTYPAIEHVIVDGASADNTVAIAKEYISQSLAAGNGHEVKLLSEPDKGIYDAMNKGIRMATGHYICFMNAGDTLHEPQTVERIADAARLAQGKETAAGGASGGGSMPAVIYGETDIVDGNRNFVRHRRLRAPERLTRKSYRNGMLVCHQAFYARTDYARQNMFNTRYRFSADFDWCLRIVTQAERDGQLMANTGTVVADYLDEGTTTRNHRASLKERFRIMCAAFGCCQTVALHAWFILRQLLMR